MHHKEVESHLLDILFSIIETSYEIIPIAGENFFKKRNKSHKIIPGWSTQVKPFREYSKHCYEKWLMAGKPSSGPIFDEKQISNSQYKYAVRRTKRQSKFHQAQSLFNAALSGDINLLQEMKRITSGKCPHEELTDELDGVTGKEEVVNMFKDVYKSLYNEAESVDGMQKIKSKIKCLVMAENSSEEVSKLTGDVVKQAVAQMKPKKKDVSGGFT